MIDHYMQQDTMTEIKKTALLTRTFKSRGEH